MKFAQYHNRAHVIIQAWDKGLVTKDFFTMARGELQTLISREIPLEKSLYEALEQLRTKHEQILCSPRVDLVTFQQAFGILEWVTRELVVAIKNGGVRKKDGQLMLPTISR